MSTNDNRHPDSFPQDRLGRVWCLANDLDIKPVEELPANLVKEIVPGGKLPDGHFGIQRKKTRTSPKIVNKDVVDVLRAFGEDGATYASVLSHFLAERNLTHEELDPGLKKLVTTLIQSHFLVEKDSTGSGESVKPAFNVDDCWLRYYVAENIVCVVDSEIYKVIDYETGQPWALKISRPTFPMREMKQQITQRLTREFTIMQQLNHPNIVKLRAWGEYNGQTYGVLEWIDGPSVYGYAYPERDSDPDDASLMALAIECVDALQAVHRAGYLHGDVHTSNFLTKNGRVCLIDFGLVRPISIAPDDSGHYSEGGVLEYMPPEMVRRSLEKKPGLSGSVAGEVYSCALILFTLFTKRYPYKRQFYRKDYMNSIINEPPLGFVECGRSPWPELEAVLHKSLAKDPGDRYQSLAELREALLGVPLHQLPADRKENQ